MKAKTSNRRKFRRGNKGGCGAVRDAGEEIMGKKMEPSKVRRDAHPKTPGGFSGSAQDELTPFRAFTYDKAMAAAEKSGERAVPTFCGMCGPTAGCGIYAFVKEGRFTKVAGMAESPVSNGGVCPKGQAAPQWVYSRDRLKHPLKRLGKKGEGKFEEITWDEAVETIAGKLKEQKNKDFCGQAPAQKILIITIYFMLIL